MTYEELPEDLYGWWRITDTSHWGNQYIDVLGPALICVEGTQYRLRMFWLIADLELMPTKTGARFTWEGMWEWDSMTGTGTLRLAKNGQKLHGTIKIKQGDSSTFVAEKTSEPNQQIPNPPRYRDKWRRRRW